MRSCTSCRPCWPPGPAPASSVAPGSTPTLECRPNEVLLAGRDPGAAGSPTLTLELEDDGAAGVAACRLGECFGGVGEAVGGGDRNRQLAVGELLCQCAQLVSVRADVDVGDRDATLLGGRVRCDRRQPPVVRDCANGVGGIAGCRVDCGGHTLAPG